MELEETNLITLCENGGTNCHFGHLGSFKSYNPHIEDDVKIWNEKMKNKPKVIL